MEKIIFLDIDGVLNVYCEGRDRFGCTFHKHFEDNLKWIIEETKAKIVISSTWRFSGLSVMQEMWEHRGLTGEVIDITPHIDICKRGLVMKYPTLTCTTSSIIKCFSLFMVDIFL